MLGLVDRARVHLLRICGQMRSCWPSPVNLRRRLVSPPMPGNEILNTPLCPPFLPFLLGYHENNQASARESSGGVTTIRSSFQRHLFPGRFLFFNSRDSLLHSAKCDRWNDGRSLDTQLVRRGEDEAASCWGRRIRLMEERWSNERIFGWRIF